MIQEDRQISLLIWFVSDTSSFLNRALEMLCKAYKDMKIAVSYNSKINVTYKGRMLPYISESEASSLNADIILAAGADNMRNNQLIERCRNLGLDEAKILPDRLPCIPGFDLRKYHRLQSSHLSVFAANCFGGILCHRLGMAFNSPFVNMFFRPMEGYLRFLEAPQQYMQEEPIFVRSEYDTILKRNYPVVRLGDIEIHMNHYPDYETALRKWQERKERINWYNLFVTMYTDDDKELERFAALPYGKKVCFTSFPSERDEAFYLPGEIPLWERVNNLSFGKRNDYDVFEMLLYGIKANFR